MQLTNVQNHVNAAAFELMMTKASAHVERVGHGLWRGVASVRLDLKDGQVAIIQFLEYYELWSEDGEMREHEARSLFLASVFRSVVEDLNKILHLN